jgi:hypothetical protein
MIPIDSELLNRELKLVTGDKLRRTCKYQGGGAIEMIAIEIDVNGMTQKEISSLSRDVRAKCKALGVIRPKVFCLGVPTELEEFFSNV